MMWEDRPNLEPTFGEAEKKGKEQDVVAVEAGEGLEWSSRGNVSDGLH